MYPVRVLLILSRRRGENFIEHALELFQSRARNDHCIPPAMGLLRDAEKSSALILAVFDEKVFALNLKLARFQNRIHVGLGDYIVSSASMTTEK